MIYFCLDKNYVNNTFSLSHTINLYNYIIERQKKKRFKYVFPAKKWSYLESN